MLGRFRSQERFRSQGTLWDYPMVTRVRERIRARTPGQIPPMSGRHPVVGLVHDVQRLFRRKVFGGRG